MENIDEVFDFYNNGLEKGRLERGLGIVEFYRTKEVLSNYIVKKGNIIYDVGGGIGVYSSWLASEGNEVHLLELAPNAVEYAIKSQSKDNLFKAEVCDARSINRENESADIVLLMGPLYHLQNKEDRKKVLNEAKRVLKKGGILFSVGISKFSSTTWAISTYGNGNEFLDDPIYFNMIQNELISGVHIRPKEYSNFITQAYFHTPRELQEELEVVGFETIQKHAIEGVIWFTPFLNEYWKDEEKRNILLKILNQTDTEESLMGMSPHFMIVSKKV
ncbi:MAG: class I SAM-dependent methyltransferase [Paeniclostridium sp.]|uniref:class I SAM-dependent methyltransferase n=1 Tax=Paraclostridium sordellii TaxID=1505 RepID=UPI0005DC73AD|nr:MULTISPECIES: class I SAM-dependent methyltransferase [Paeniclostridium]MBW4861608.1 class I SAM-dependent methyltransferase [Paeniclostridium sp.]MBW4875512.1 class I SAM-dependent methyltransferase [Paeniclostridium sp.]CEN93922.1 type 11 methyltransferase [[Clostridium] sordellii] [Paeniclostridium sordellii]CEN94353.1 type 11 methyltransferase [[Clostridium] sordellii] [Paeniclostridium sordellii]